MHITDQTAAALPPPNTHSNRTPRCAPALPPPAALLPPAAHRKFVSNLERRETKRYLEMFYILLMRDLVKKVSSARTAWAQHGPSRGTVWAQHGLLLQKQEGGPQRGGGGGVFLLNMC